MSGSNKYWAKRARQRMDDYHKGSDRVIGKVLESYQDAVNEINNEMQHIFNTYAAANKMTAEEAKQLLTTIEKKKYLDRLRKRIDGIEDEGLKTDMLKQINAPAYRARLTRLQAMKEKLNVETKKLADVQVREIEKGFINTARTAYYRTIFHMQQRTGYGFSFADIPTKQVEEILKNNWSGKHYSKRIWKNTDKLASELEHTLTKGFMNGASMQRMIKEISDRMQVGKFEATRLVRTETTYVANSAELAAYKEAGVEKYEFLAALDTRTSDICRRHDRKIYDVKDAAPGVNMPPLHANCRSTTLEVFDEDNLEDLKRRARDPVTYENKTVPANMTYEKWYAENVANNPKAIAEEKKIKNRASDNAQYERYSNVLGKDFKVKDFASFQDLKYNNSEEWENLKSVYNEVFVTKDYAELESLFKENLSNLQTRKWYKWHDENIPYLIDKSKSLEEQAKQAHNLRNKYRTEARNLMVDQVERKKLDSKHSNPTFEDLLEHKKFKYGLSDEEAFIDIIRSSQTTNKKYDKIAGIKEE